jgi:hypothetical protein
MIALAGVYRRFGRVQSSIVVGASGSNPNRSALGARFLVVSDGSYPGREVLLIDYWMGHSNPIVEDRYGQATARPSKKELDSVSCFQNRYLGYKFWRQQRHNE